MKKILLIGLLFCLFMAASWLVSVGIVWLICLCFALKFKLSIATGIWLVLMLLSGAMGSKSRK